MSVTPSEFRLSPQEDFVFGVRMRGSTLSFGPSGSEVASAVVPGLVSVVVGASMVLGAWTHLSFGGHPVEHPGALRVLGAATILYAVALLAAMLRAGVSADADGLVLRRFWRDDRLLWEDIRDVRAHETAPRRWDVLAGLSSLTARMRPIPSYAIGLVERSDGTVVQLPGFVAAARKDGLSLGTATVVELKVQALNRFRSHATGLPLAPVSGAVPATAPSLVGDSHSRWVVVAWLAGLVAYWLLVSWAVGTLMNPLPLIAGIVIVLGLEHRRRTR